MFWHFAERSNILCHHYQLVYKLAADAVKLTRTTVRRAAWWQTQRSFRQGQQRASADEDEDEDEKVLGSPSRRGHRRWMAPGFRSWPY